MQTSSCQVARVLEFDIRLDFLVYIVVIIYYHHSIMSAPAPVPADIINTAITAFTGLAIAITGLVAAGLKWWASRSNNPRLTVLEKQAETAEKDIEDLQGMSGTISTVATNMPQVQQFLQQNQQKILDMEKALQQAQQQIKELQALVPEGATVSAKALMRTSS